MEFGLGHQQIAIQRERLGLPAQTMMRCVQSGLRALALLACLQASGGCGSSDAWDAQGPPAEPKSDGSAATLAGARAATPSNAAPPNAAASQAAASQPAHGAASAARRYELAIRSGGTELGDPIRLISNGSAGYPKLAVQVRAIDADGATIVVPAKVDCMSTIRCALRGPGIQRERLADYAITLDTPAIAQLRPGKDGVELVATSMAFPVNTTMQITLSSEDGPQAVRRISFFGRQ